MSAVLDQKKDPAAKFDAQVDEQLAQATSRIRFHDLALGALSLAALGLVYATAMLLLDRNLELPEWVRQLSLVGFLLSAGAIAYFLLVRPLRRDINPLYAAVQVERTIDDAKNSVAGYVDAKEKGDVHPSVRTAMGARAAKSVVKADLNRAVDHRSLIYAGGVGVFFLLVLLVLFFLFGFNQFTSVLRRTFVPFTSDPIATRTQLRITKPEPADATIIAGQTVVIGVEVSGRIPELDQPDRVRVLIRHNPADPTTISLDMEPGESKRDWQVRVPLHLVQNGFWYRVAAGDAESPEYRVVVRSLPQIDKVEVAYQYPAYANALPGTRKDARIEALRGTKVAVTARANTLGTPTGEVKREVKEARLVIEYPADPATGAPAESVVVPWNRVEGQPDAMRFTFRIQRKGTYKIQFTTVGGERNPDPQPDEIHITPDDKPEPLIQKPVENPVTIPANGQLAVDAAIADDYGVDTVTLKMRIAGPNPVPLPDRPFLNNGNPSFRRIEADGRATWSRRPVEFKESVDLATLVGLDGKPVKLSEGMELEYWIEAADNRHDETDAGAKPTPQLGQSAIRTVKFGPPTMTPAEQKKQDEQKQNRKMEEKQQNDEQQQQRNNEQRDPKPQPGDKNSAGEPQPENPQNKPQDNTMPKSGGTEADSQMPPPMPGDKNSTEPMPKKSDAVPPPMPKTPEPMANPMDKGMTSPMTGSPMPKEKMGDPGMGNMPNPGMPPPSPMDSKPDPEKSKEFEQAIKDAQQNATEGGSPKPEPPKSDPMNPPSDAKSKPSAKPMAGDDQQSKPEPKPMDGSSGASESKPEPQQRAGNEPAKQEPKPTPMGGMANDPKAEPHASEAKPEPMAGAQAGDKPPPPPKKDSGVSPMPNPNDPQGAENQARKDPSGGGEAKPEPTPGKMPESSPSPKTNPGAAQPQASDPSSQTGMAKPQPENDQGSDKNTPQPPKNSEPTDSAAKTNSGEAKPEQPSAASQAKAAPKDEPKGSGAAQPKPEPKGGASAEPKPAEPKDTSTAGANAPKPQDAGQDKPVDPKDNVASGGTPEKKDNKAPKSGSGQQKIDPKDVVETAKDLNDPNKQQAAQQKLDKNVGPENRKEIEKNAKDLDSKDKNAQAAAEKKVEDIANKAAAEQQKNDPTQKAGKPKLDPKDLEKAVKDANSGNPMDRKNAEEQLNKLSPEDRKKAEEIAKGLDSKDPKEQAAAKQQLEEMKKDAEAQAKKNPDAKKPELTPKDIDDLKAKSQDLNSPDQQKRVAAERAFDEKIGKEEREKLQQKLEDAAGAPEAKAELAKERLEQLAKKGRGSELPQGDPNPNPPGPAPDPKLEAAKEDVQNRLKTAELQLELFEKNRYDKAIQDAKGWTQKEVDDLINGKRKEVDDLKVQLQDLEQGKQPSGPATTNAGEARKLDSRNGSEGPTGRGGEAKTPPGYNKAQDAFNKGILKMRP